MKKELIIPILLITIILASFLISAQAQPPLPPGFDPKSLEEKKEKIDEVKENLENDETRSDYLKQEWGKILENNTFFAPIIGFFNYISPITNPIFTYTIGMEPTWTWTFILNLIHWIFLLIIILRISEIFSLLSKSLKIIISLSLIIAISLLGITKTLSEAIINLITSLTTIWYFQIIFWFIYVIILVILILLSKKIQKSLIKSKEKQAKFQTELDRKQLHRDVQISKRFTDTFSS